MESACLYPVGLSLVDRWRAAGKESRDHLTTCMGEVRGWVTGKGGTARQDMELNPGHLKLSFQPFTGSCDDRIQGVATM